MRKTIKPVVFLTSALVVIVPMTGAAQDFFRDLGTSRSSGGIGPVVPSEYTYQDTSPNSLQAIERTSAEDEIKHSNFAIGALRFSLAAGFGAEFNDNIILSNRNRQSDIILRPSLTVDAFLPVSQLNTLRFSVGISYAKYLNHSEYDTDGVLITPTSELEFKFGIGEVKLVLRDRFSYQEDPFDVAQISNVAKYGRYENQVGLKADYSFNSVISVSAGIDHFNLWTTEDTFKDQDRMIDTVFVKPAWQITERIKTGLNASYSHIDFSSSQRPDGDSVLAGPFVSVQLSETTNVYLEGGYQSLTNNGQYVPTNLLNQLDLNLTKDQRRAFEQGSSDSGDSQSYYIRAEIDHKLNDVFQHRLSFSKTSEIGFFTNYFDLYHVEYNAEFTGLRKASIAPSVFYEYYETSGANTEKSSRVGAALGFRYYLTNSITVGLDYRFLLKDSNLDGGDYYQNLGFFSIYYKF